MIIIKDEESFYLGIFMEVFGWYDIKDLALKFYDIQQAKDFIAAMNNLVKHIGKYKEKWCDGKIEFVNI